MLNWNYNVVSYFQFVSFMRSTEIIFSNVAQFRGVEF